MHVIILFLELAYKHEKKQACNNYPNSNHSNV